LPPITPSLAHRLQIPINLIELAGKTNIEHVAFLVAGRIQKADIVLLVEGIIPGQFVGAEHLPLDAQRVESEMAVRVSKRATL
jgi:hypothetical protein